MTQRFILEVTTTTTNEAEHRDERAPLANLITKQLEPFIIDRADPRLRKIAAIHLSTPDGLVSISMDREVRISREPKGGSR